MLCQNCNKNEASVRYTEIINGEKKEMMLCENCSHELGIDNINFSMPINFSNFFGEMLDDTDYSNSSFIPMFENVKELKCDNCDMTYNEFIEQGKLGCPECYDIFSSKIDNILKRIHGSSKYLGRSLIDNKIEDYKTNKEPEKNKNNERIAKKENKLDDLQKDLKRAISEERYEDAAKIRDEIKKIGG